MSWDYGDAYKRYPVTSKPYKIGDIGVLQVHDIFDPLPDFMLDADLMFVDPPWNKGNLSCFYTKAGIDDRPYDTFDDFYNRLFECISQIKPRTLYLEVGKQHLADFIMEVRKQYRYVTFYNSTYYHNKRNLCYIVRGSNKAKKPYLDGMDEEDIIKWVCENETYDTIGDLCMGRGLVAYHAHMAGKKYVGTELNHKRLSVAIERIAEAEDNHDKSGRQEKSDITTG